MSDHRALEAASEKALRGPLAASLGVARDGTSPRLLDMLRPRRLQIAGYVLAAVYACVFLSMYRWGDWLIDSDGRPIFNDFTNFWIVARQALHGDLAWLRHPVNYTHIAASALGGAKYLHSSYLPYSKWAWPYPPIFVLVLAPFAAMPYLTAFISFQSITLLGCAAVVYLIVRRKPAIALVLASPLGALNIYWGQTGLLRAALAGAGLYMLERRPLISGMLIGCLTFKPQFGILYPLAFVAARQWRAFASAAVTAVFLTAISIAAFGLGPWLGFARSVGPTAEGVLLLGRLPWTDIQTVYGVVRAFHGSAALAWLSQGCATAATAVAVWLVWRSPARYALKAALLSAATLIATPYAWAFDLSAIVIPVAFLAADQIRCGLWRGEQTTLVTLFGLAFAILLCEGTLPLGPAIVVALMVVILRRVLADAWGVAFPVAQTRL
jgi:hypothetical protein